MNQSPREIVDTMLGYLGFFVEIEEQEHNGQPVIQIITSDQDLLVGRGEEVMNDIQFLLNRILHAKQPDIPRMIVDVGHRRIMHDDTLIQKVRHMAESVRISGQPVHTEPLNSYDRRIVHNAFVDDPEIATASPKDDARLKRITIKRRTQRPDSY